ncbi:RNA 3'-terminal phosphate cyclase [Rubritalea tangerina]|uniref:RNA 3'-terminal phosphate cyclase n=1 Tax=Rubritalea tangerina TaxID=430798 RepID=A0ABW4ZG90_9BACT
MLEINGSDGGGQVLRSALSLSMVTGRAFRMVQIRGGRKKPGLMRQHLTCVRAAAEVSGAQVSGAEMGSQELYFEPGEVQAGEYSFKIGSAGSTTLVFQTLLPALMLAEGMSVLRVRGGTHNPLAPSADYIAKVFLPAVRKLGVSAVLECERVGFAPAGGGEIVARVEPSVLVGASFCERGALLRRELSAMVANLSGEIMRREVNHAAKRLAWESYDSSLDQVKLVDGAGNCFAVHLDYEHVSERFTDYGAYGLSAERVAGRVVKQVREFLKVPEAAFGEHLADQVLLPMALAGTGSFTTAKMTNHLRTNMRVIQQFLDVKISVEGDETGLWTFVIGR